MNNTDFAEVAHLIDVGRFSVPLHYKYSLLLLY